MSDTTNPKFNTNEKYEIISYLLLDQDYDFSTNKLNETFKKQFKTYFYAKNHNAISNFRADNISKDDTKEDALEKVFNEHKKLKNIEVSDLKIVEGELKDSSKLEELKKLAWRKVYITDKSNFWKNFSGMVSNVGDVPTIETKETVTLSTTKDIFELNYKDANMELSSKFNKISQIPERVVIGEILKSIVMSMWNSKEITIKEEIKNRYIKNLRENIPKNVMIANIKDEGEKKKAIDAIYKNIETSTRIKLSENK